MFVVADVVMVIPCSEIDPDSWRWIFSGCFLFDMSIVEFWALALLVGVVSLLVRFFWSLRGHRGLAA